MHPLKSIPALLIVALLPALPASADDSIRSAAEPLSFSGYGEAYYLFDEHLGQDRRRPAFVYSHNRSNQAALNLALVKAQYATSNVRASLGLAGGSYMQANYAAEPGILRHIFEANAGFRLSAGRDLWLDVGVLPSHIGFESAIGADNWTLTRSVMADNSPYFETGARLSYRSADGRWYAAALLLNGWQRIQRPDGNTTPSIGHQLTFQPNDRITLNSSSFIGNDKSDQDRRLRYFHNLYGQFRLGAHWSLIAGLDLGLEQDARGSSNHHRWVVPAVIARYAPPGRVSWSLRAEAYLDAEGVIVASTQPGGFGVHGYSVNLDYALTPELKWRFELRHLRGRNTPFPTDSGNPAGDSLIATTALTVTF